MDKKVLVVAVIAVVIIAAAAAVLLNPGNGDKEDSKTGYTITFDANGGSGTMAPVTGVTGTYIVPKTCDFTAPEGCSFVGWGLSRAMTVPDVIVEEDVTLYAIWHDDRDKGITVITDPTFSDPIISDIGFIYESGGKKYNPTYSEFKTSLVPFYGSATMTIKVNGSSDWSYTTGKLDADDEDDAGIFEFTYNGEKYKLAFAIPDAKFSGNAGPTPTFTFSSDEGVVMGLYIIKVA